jgi:putative ABC transport system ATP-binding protein
MLMFTLKNVSYKNILQIDELTIAPGIITAIVGESGSGKTTMLKLLNHMINYSEGTVTYRGQELKSLDAVLLRRKVTMVPQIPVIFPGTVRDNLLIGLIFAGKEAVSDDRINAELARIGLDKKLDDPAELLSGGEKQRLALARVILMNPDVLLLDEPTSALDEDSEGKITAYINDYLGGEDKSVVMVTHSKQLALQVARKIITVSKGTITAVEEVA